MGMQKITIALLTILALLFASQSYSAQIPLSRWMPLRSDATEEVKKIISSEVDKQDGYSLPQEEKANVDAVETERGTDDAAYKKTIANANKEFVQAKKRRDDLTAQFQAISIDLEEQQKGMKTIRTGLENLDSQILRYNQDIRVQQEALKKWLQTEKQGEALTAVIFTRGFKDDARSLENMSDQASVLKMTKFMGTYIQSFTEVINVTLSSDFIRSVEEGTVKWNNEEPLRIELQKGNKGTTYLRLKRYELYPFQPPKGGRASISPAAKNIQAIVATTPKELDDFLVKSGFSPGNYDLAKAYGMIKEASQAHTGAGEGLQEQIGSFQNKIGSLKERIRASQSEKELQLTLLSRKEEPIKKTTGERDLVQAKKDAAELAFQAAQKSLHDIRRVRESIIIKSTLATARGSQTPANASAEAIIDKLEEVKNDAKTRHSSSTTEVTNFQVTAESSYNAVTEARITAVRLLSFINEGDSVRVKVAFRIMTMLEEQGEEDSPKTPQSVQQKAVSPRPAPTKPLDKKSVPPDETPGPAAVVSDTEQVKLNPRALGASEAKDVLFEVISAKQAGDQISVYVDMTNRAADSSRNVALYDDVYGWKKSKLTDDAGKEYEVSQVIFWKGTQQTSMRDAGRNGISLDAKTKQAAQLIFKKTPPNVKIIRKLTLHPYIGSRAARIMPWSWLDRDLPFQDIRVTR
jgi:peptidoglycan hydrolase CwlO-like protein